MTQKFPPQWVEVTSRHNVTAYQLDSALVGDRLEITVSSPPLTPADWPTLYALDPFITLEMVIGLSRLFGSFSSGQVPPALVVGVGYPTLDPAQVMTLRARDLTPTGQGFPPELSLNPPWD